MYKTTNGGTSWTLQAAFSINNLSSVSYTNANNITVVGQFSTILKYTNGSVPVELISFTGRLNGSNVTLNWGTATEINNYGFEIEKMAGKRQTDAGSWEKIGFVNGTGTTTFAHYYSFADKNVSAGNYTYRLKQIDQNGKFTYSKTIEVNTGVPAEFVLLQNYPNPFNPSTIIRFEVPKSSRIKLTIYNMIGETVKVLSDAIYEAGVYEKSFDARDLASGVYIYQLRANDFIMSKKMVLTK
jgi:hypothetical protein